MSTAATKTTFFVTHAGNLPTAKTIYIQGRLKAGKVNGGSVLQVCGSPDKLVRVKSVALINAASDLSEFTLSIEEPTFPLSELEGAELVEAV